MATFSSTVIGVVDTSSLNSLDSACTAAANDIETNLEDIIVEGLVETLIGLEAEIQTAVQDLGCISSTLSKHQVPSDLQQAYNQLNISELCTLVNSCSESATQLTQNMSTLLRETSVAVSVASGHCRRLVAILKSLPTLPPGLSLNEQTGAISGILQKPVRKYEYTLTEYNNVNKCSASACLTVREQAAPSGLEYDPVWLNKPIIICETPRPPVEIRVAQTFNSGYPPPLFYCTQPLPEGLTINSGTGTISGSPILETQKTVYNIVAENKKGSCVCGLALEVQLHLEPSAIQYNTLSRHEDLYSLFIEGSDVKMSPKIGSQKGTHLKFSVEPALPKGLHLSQNDGVISGRVEELQQKVTYTITASNVGLSTGRVGSGRVGMPYSTGRVGSGSGVL